MIKRFCLLTILIFALCVSAFASVTVTGHFYPQNNQYGMPTNDEVKRCRAVFSDTDGNILSPAVAPNNFLNFSVTFDLSTPPIQNLLADGFCVRGNLGAGSPQFHLDNTVDGTTVNITYTVYYLY
jgi:hypothetical protein